MNYIETINTLRKYSPYAVTLYKSYTGEGSFPPYDTKKRFGTKESAEEFLVNLRNAFIMADLILTATIEDTGFWDRENYNPLWSIDKYTIRTPQEF